MFEFDLFGWATLGWLFLSSFVILYFCGNPAAPGPIGLASGLVYLLVELVGRAFRWAFGNRVTDSIGAVWHYIFRRANPILQCCYLALVNGGYVLFYIYGQSQFIHPESMHHYFIYLCMIMNFVTFLICSNSNPGVVTKENTAEFSKMFPYDNQMYLEHLNCPTCLIEKPARSKHCGFCDQCVMKFDHHCVWTNRCIGMYNYKYFLWFLYQHVWFTGYGTYLVAYMLLHVIETKELFHLSYRDPATGQYLPATAMFVFQYISYYHGVLWGLLMLLFIMVLVLAGFTMYHTYLALSNMTTNERSKLGWIKQGINVHSHHEILILNPYYEKQQKELKKLNNHIVILAHQQAGWPVPASALAAAGANDGNNPSKAGEKAPSTKSAAVASTASAAKAKSSDHSSLSDGIKQTDPAQPRIGAAPTAATLPAGTAAASATAAGSSSSSGPAASFPPPPYSPELTAMMQRFHELKAEVLALYEKLKILQQQGFINEQSKDKLVQGAESYDATKVVESFKAETAAAKAHSDKKFALPETTEGCIPTSGAADAVAASPNVAGASSSSGSKPKRQRRSNPYSLGIIGNFWQVIQPPKPGTKIPFRNFQQPEGHAGSKGANKVSKKAR